MKTKLAVLTTKEFKHILRDPKLSLILALFPLFLLIFFGYAINFDLKKIKISVCDYDNSDLSRKIIRELKSSDRFEVISINSKNNFENFYKDKITASVIIPKNFSAKFLKNDKTEIQTIISASDANAAAIIEKYFQLFFSSFVLNQLSLNSASYTPAKLNVSFVFKYNPQLNTTLFFMPGLIAMILMTISAVAVSLSFVKEIEMGTIEQLILSPIGNLDYTLSKIIPYVIICLVEAILLLVISSVVFDLKYKGSLLEFFAVTAIYLTCGLGIGLFISSIANSQQIAFLLSALISLLPTFLLSGFVFNIESMPYVIQLLTNLTPAKFYIASLRDILIRGASFESYAEDFFALVFFAFAICVATAISINQQKKNLFDV